MTGKVCRNSSPDDDDDDKYDDYDDPSIVNRGLS